MPFIIHAYILLRKTTCAISFEESAVPSIEDVDFGIAELRVLIVVNTTITMTEVLCPFALIRRGTNVG